MIQLQAGKFWTRQRLELALLTAAVFGIAALYECFFRPGVTWADDWAMYIQDALNILRGDRYSTTGYIFNPNTDIGPTAYPPLFPLALTLPIALRGIDFHAIRQLQTVFWVAFLYLFYFLARFRLGFGFALLLVAATGLSPYFLVFKDYIASESLFLPLVYGFFLLAARIEGKSPDGEIAMMDGVWLGLLASLCIATRSMGLVLLAVLGGYDLLHYRRLRRATLVAIAIAGCSFLLQLGFVDFLKDYAANVSLNGHAEMRKHGGANLAAGGVQGLLGLLSVMAHRPITFIGELSRLWGQGNFGGWLPRIVTVLLVAMAGYGFTIVARRRLMHCDIFFALYCAALLVLPPAMAGARMQMPVYPLFYLYVLVAATARRGGRVWQAGMFAMLALTLACYWQSFRNLDFRAPLAGFQTTDYREMFGYIENHTGPEAVVIFDKPRTLSLYTRHRSAAIYNARDGAEFLSEMRRFGGTHLLLYEPRNAAPKESLRDLVGDDAGRFVLIHASGDYILYALKNGLAFRRLENTGRFWASYG